MSEPVDLMEALKRSLERAKQSQKANQHNHREYVDGCFRCDLSREEVETTDDH